MTIPFVRQLQSQPGVQLNPIQDRTPTGILGTFDTSVAMPARLTRGRIDKPFSVNFNTYRTLAGKGESIALSALNEAYVMGYEALQRGATQLILYRLTTAAAAISWVTFTSGATSVFAVSPTASLVGTFSVKHLGCHNDGIRVEVHADTKLALGVPVDNDLITVIIRDADSVELYRVTGSLTIGAKNEFGESIYLPDVSEQVTDLLEWQIPLGATIGPTHDGYGKNTNSVNKFAVTAAPMVAFVEGSTAYASTDYDRAITAFRTCNEDYGYVMSGATKAVALLIRLADLGYHSNRQFLFDIPGDLSKSAAIAFMESLGFGGIGTDHYPQAYFAPLKRLDPVNGGMSILGTSGIQIGMRCARNSVTNAYGLAAKNQPIAGVNGNVGAAGKVSQVLTLDEDDKSDLAKARINPVIYQVFSGGGIYAFADSLTAATSELSPRRLIATAEMSSHVDQVITRYGRELLQSGMEVGIQRMEDFLRAFDEQLLASGWIVARDGIPPSEFTVTPDPLSPRQRLFIEHKKRYDGTIRQITVSQILV